MKKRCAPIYIDTLEKPYAKFVFKYRTKEQLKHEIGVDVSGEPSGNEEVNALEHLDKAALIQLVLRAKGALGGAIPEPPPRPTPKFTNDFQQIPVPAPDMSYLSYNLPALRNVSNNAGLGIRYSSSSQGNGGTPNQNNNANGGAGNWQDSNNNQQNTWNNGGNGDQSWATNNQQQNNNSGWDGAQERRTSMAPSRPYQNSLHPSQAPSRRSSGISAKTTQHHAPQPTSMDEAFDEAFGGSSDAPMAGPPPPEPITFGPEGTTGGGQMEFKGLGAGPRPGTAVNSNQGGDEAGTQPKGGW